MNAFFHVPASGRVTTGPLASTDRDGNNGAFRIESCEPGWQLVLMCSDGMGWEHVSVRAVSRSGARSRVPTWREMAFVKNACWDADATVVQYHPARANYVNIHPDVLHLWRPIGVVLPTPPLECV